MQKSENFHVNWPLLGPKQLCWPPINVKIENLLNYVMWGIKQSDMKPSVDLQHIYNKKYPQVAKMAIFRPKIGQFGHL